LHPFREGNGRSTREFIRQLVSEAGYELDQTRIDNNSDQWSQASAAGHFGKLGPIKAIFADAIEPATSTAFRQPAPPLKVAVDIHPTAAQVPKVGTVSSNELVRICAGVPGKWHPYRKPNR